MSKLLAAVFAALIVGVGVAAAGSLTASSDDPAHTGTDISTIESTGTTETTATTETGEDVSGPCDEAEHANDPRCTGVVTTDDDERGRHGDDDHRGRGEDRSGSNSGPSDHSGHGSDDD
jgi:hypothetical protein